MLVQTYPHILTAYSQPTYLYTLSAFGFLGLSDHFSYEKLTPA